MEYITDTFDVIESDVVITTPTGGIVNVSKALKNHEELEKLKEEVKIVKKAFKFFAEDVACCQFSDEELTKYINEVGKR